MALTSSRWIMVAVVGCAVLTAGLAPSGNGRLSNVSESPEFTRLRRLQGRTFDAAIKLRALTRRDSVLASLRANASGHPGTPRTFVPQALDGQTLTQDADATGNPLLTF